MTDFLPIRCDLPDSPVVKALAKSIGESEEHALGILVRFWIHCRRHIDEHGRIPYVDHPTLRAIESIGWAEVTPDGVVIPEHEHWITAKFRRTSSGRSYGNYFDEIWDAVWKKSAKHDADRAYHQAHKRLMDEKGWDGVAAHVCILSGVKDFSRSDAAMPSGLFDGYVPPALGPWLRAGRYEDDRSTWKATSKPDDARDQAERVSHD